jgi:hypothetical protein
MYVHVGWEIIIAKEIFFCLLMIIKHEVHVFLPGLYQVLLLSLAIKILHLLAKIS